MQLPYSPTAPQHWPYQLPAASNAVPDICAVVPPAVPADAIPAVSAAAARMTPVSALASTAVATAMSTAIPDLSANKDAHDISAGHNRSVNGRFSSGGNRGLWADPIAGPFFDPTAPDWRRRGSVCNARDHSWAWPVWRALRFHFSTTQASTPCPRNATRTQADCTRKCKAVAATAAANNGASSNSNANSAGGDNNCGNPVNPAGPKSLIF